MKKNKRRKKAYYNYKLKESEIDSKVLYGVIYEITGNKTERLLPDCDNIKELANDFAGYFIPKSAIILIKLYDYR